MFNRIKCHFFGHLPRRHTVTKSPFSPWTVCGRCDRLMTRGYFGWQPANAMEKRRFERELAKRAAACLPLGVATDDAALDTSVVPLPWMQNEDAETDEAAVAQPEGDAVQPIRLRTTASRRSG